MPSSRLTVRGAAVAVTALLAAVASLFVTSPAYAGTGTLVRQPSPAGSPTYGVKVTVLYTSNAPTTAFRLEFDLPEGSSVIPFGSLPFTRTGNHWVSQFAAASPQTAGVRFETGFAVLGTGDPTNCRLDGNPCTYTVLSDTEAPTVPGNVVATRATWPGVGTGVTLRWSASTDNFGVTGYEVTVNGQPYTTTTQLYQTVPHFANAATTYAVRARDSVGNVSAYASFVLPPM
ncbi:hypothetical protein [Dactylosporangium sp. NPDC005555]|uniref:hypothetical protein n=1 Tax=Dactylosporangium sp. NPDC005555 TaxID=3154889 RepID=UPI0033AC95E1